MRRPAKRILSVFVGAVAVWGSACSSSGNETTSLSSSVLVSEPAKTVPPISSAPSPAETSVGIKPATASAACDPIRVMPLGDSLTSYLESYRGPLFRSLTVAGWNVDFVGSGSGEPIGGGDPDHEGHGGYRIGPDAALDWEGNPANLANGIGGWIPKAKPEVIVLNIGTNDVAAGGETSQRAPAQLTGLVAALRTLAPDAQIVVGDLPPNAWVPEGTSETQAVGTAAQQIAKASPDFVQFTPVYNRMRANGFDLTPGVGTTDNTHFTVSGGIAFAAVLEPEVVGALQRVRRC